MDSDWYHHPDSDPQSLLNPFLERIGIRVHPGNVNKPLVLLTSTLIVVSNQSYFPQRAQTDVD